MNAIELAPVFQSVQTVMEVNRLAFNQADTVNGNHGDHMVEIFAVAVRAAQGKGSAGLADAMDEAGHLLDELPQNGSARVYGRGLAQLGSQFRKYDLTQDELVSYLRKALQEEPSQPVSPYFPSQADTDQNLPSARSGEVLKALIAALAGWQQDESGGDKQVNPLDLGYMFDLGIAYMQAKQRNSNRIAVIADVAASVSPLKQVPYRYLSGKLAIQTLLEAMVGAGLT